MDRPRLRNVERIPLSRGGEQLVVLRDPMGIAESLAIDADLVAILDAIDGKRNPAQIRQSLLMTKSLDVPLPDLVALLADLDEAGLLEGERFKARWSDIHDAFFDADERAPQLAGVLYAEDPAALSRELDEHIGALAITGDASAVLVPHGPPAIVGHVLAQTLPALPAADALDFVVLLGADHHPGLLPYTVLDKPWRTPLGVAPCESDVAAALVRRVPWLDREAIRHRIAHSIEWALLYLQHAWGGRVPPIVPILCGATTCADGRAHDGVAELATALESMLDGARALVVASAELTHAGPAYGRPLLDAAGIAAVEARDRDLLGALVRHRARDVLVHGIDVAGQGRPSGLPVLLTLAETLAVDVRTRISAYELAQVPGRDVGWIGLAGLVCSAA
ncbi:MAG TPA: AmmeMemoRadiSam system protein B [Nannocystaceae bacterium]|nr:AmmeMemoRadiSam system protein B [Nannocystaceae bacterium]